MRPAPILLWGLLAAPSTAALQADEPAARVALAEARELAANGRYERARQAFEDLAQRYPETEAGRTALRRIQPNALLGSTELVRHGSPGNRVRVVVMGDGFPLKKQGAFDDLAADVPREFERDTVLGEYYAYFDFVRANVISEEAGLDGYGREASTALGGHVVSAAHTDLVGVDHSAVREVMRELGAPEGTAIVFVPRGNGGTGGGGVAVLVDRRPRVLIHEFGHAFAGLADEYATYTGHRGEVASAPNVSSTEDPEQAPWAHWIEARAKGVGLYEGADGRVRDAWRPTASGCRMNNAEFFCPVCREALILRIYRDVDPIEAAGPRDDPEVPPEATLTLREPREFEVVVLEPDRHPLEVSWWVLSQDEAPPPAGDPTLRPRTRRGALASITARPVRRGKPGSGGVSRLRVSPRDLGPGRYRVVCRVRDTTQLRGEKLPWVLRDEHDLLASERAWWVVVEE